MFEVVVRWASDEEDAEEAEDVEETEDAGDEESESPVAAKAFDTEKRLKSVMVLAVINRSVETFERCMMDGGIVCEYSRRCYDTVVCVALFPHLLNTDFSEGRLRLP